jgi:hypothetical protein
VGLRRGARWLWWTYVLSGAPGFLAALGVHVAVGYLDLWHLFPGLLALGLYLTALGLTYSLLAQRWIGFHGSHRVHENSTAR